MKKTILIFSVVGSLFLSSCENNSTPQNTSFNSEEESQEQATLEEQTVELRWNFKGSIGDFPIKAQIDFKEATHNEFSGAVSFPITGYYFYESHNKKIPLEGEANGIGMLWLTAGDESFDGEVVGNAMLENFEGTWTKGSKSLRFVLNSR